MSTSCDSPMSSTRFELKMGRDQDSMSAPQEQRSTGHLNALSFIDVIGMANAFDVPNKTDNLHGLCQLMQTTLGAPVY